MSHPERENLSALVDGELSRDQVRFMLRRVGGDAVLRRAWTRYHIIGDGIRHEVCVLADTGFAERVMSAIDGDHDAAVQPRGSRTHHWLRWSAGGAIAAGVAAVALIVVQPQTVQRAPVAAPAGAHLAASQPVAPRSQPMAAPAVPRWLSASPAAAQLAQPAAADFYAAGPGWVVSPRSYGQHRDSYMTLPGYRTPTTREARQAMYQLWSMSPHPSAPPPALLRVPRK